MISLVFVVFISLTNAHYGDPYKKQCEKDEIDATLNGIPGAVCLPPCNTDGSCPTDVPPNVTATPQCLVSDQNGNKYCILVCKPAALVRSEDAQCGLDASCKPTQTVGTGLCTYDDAPPPPSSEHWKAVDSPSFDDLSVALVVAFDSDGKTGYVGAGQNGVGVTVMKSENSGLDWYQVWPANGTMSGDLLLAAACKDGNDAVVTGVLFELYTVDGVTFNKSGDDFLDPSQDAKVIKATGQYAIAAQGNKFNGVATSSDGRMWKNFDLGNNNFPSRYGSYPSAKTWYVTGGMWPPNLADAGLNLRRLSHKVAVNMDTMKMHYTLPAPTPAASAPAPSPPPSGNWSAGIFKTVNAGQSFVSVFQDTTSGFYPNDIDCIDVNTCIAVVEGTQCQILLTTDGGKTWKSTNTDTDPHCSLTDVAFLTPTEIWVGGGHMTALDFEGRFWHSLDGGHTWTKEAIKDLYIWDLDMQSPTSGYAVALTIESGVELMKYDPNGSVPVSFIVETAETL